MQKVKLNKPHTAALDGVNVVDYPKGAELVVSDEVAAHWAEAGLIGRRRAPGGHQPKAEVDAAPEADAAGADEPAGDEAAGEDGE